MSIYLQHWYINGDMSVKDINIITKGEILLSKKKKDTKSPKKQPTYKKKV